MSKANLKSALEAAAKRGVFAGAVLLVSRGGTVLFHEAAGQASLAPRRVEMTRTTLFDLASLTKPVATTAAVMRLVDRGALSIDEPVRRRLPEFAGEGKESVLIRHLLNHSSGLRAWEPFYQEVGGEPDARRRILGRVSRNRLVYPPGEKSLYSDLGFILLGEIVERAGGLPLDRFCRREIFSPLRMTRTFFIRRGMRRRGPFAATERSARRGGVISGAVHDDNALALGGVAGHAGLFGSAADLNRFAQAMLRSLRGEPGPFRRATAEAFTARQGTPGSSWALGWDTPSEPSSSGRFFSKRSFGHLGFTGTSIWIDPERDLTVILLTNRVHPTSRNLKIRAFRPMIHDLIHRELIAGGNP